MHSINKILVVIDPTVERDFVMDRAKLVAKSTKASLHLLINNQNTLNQGSYYYEGIDSEFFETQRRLFRENYEKLLSKLKSELNEDGIEADTQFTEANNLAEAIIDHARELRADLVLKSTHHHGILERGILTNTDWRLIRKCPTPLMLVKRNSWHEQGPIYTAIDPLHVKAEQANLDHALLDTSVALGRMFNQTVKVFHSYYPFVSAMFPLGGETEEYLAKIRDQHLHKVLETTKQHGLGEESLELRRGELLEDLTKLLNESNANLLVIGALSRNFLERAIVGNTAEKILESCPCDVLILKAHQARD